MIEFSDRERVLVTYDPLFNHWQRGVVICAYIGASMVKYQVKLDDGVRDTFTSDFMKRVPVVDLLAEVLGD